MSFFWNRKRCLRDLKALKSRSVFIVGNGPSLTGADLDLLEGSVSFASNAVYLIFDKTNWRPDYYSCVDTAVLPDRAEEIGIWVKRLRRTSFVFPDSILAHGDRVEEMAVSDLIKPKRNVFYYSPASLDLSKEETCFDFSADSNVIRDSMTVTIVLMQMAVKLGARNLYLIGCDTDYVVPEDATILDTETKRVDKRIILDSDSDPNHFDERYFGAGKVWHTPNTELMIRHYEVVNKLCRNNGISVFNAGRGGKLEVFPRVSLEEAVERVKDDR